MHEKLKMGIKSGKIISGDGTSNTINKARKDAGLEGRSKRRDGDKMKDSRSGKDGKTGEEAKGWQGNEKSSKYVTAPVLIVWWRLADFLTRSSSSSSTARHGMERAASSVTDCRQLFPACYSRRLTVIALSNHDARN